MDRAQRILDTTQYGSIFKPSTEDIKHTYLELVKTFHPDYWDDARANDVFAHITDLREQALEDIESGIWIQKDRISVRMMRGGWVTVEYDECNEFELGKTYIGKNRIMYLLDSEHEEYYENAVKCIENLSYSGESMRQEFENVLPRIVRCGITYGDKRMIVLDKRPEEYPLTVILNKLGGVMDPRHVAWIISRLCNICCYLQYRGIAHNGITSENILVNPVDHTISLPGGWWYAVNEGKPMTGTTAEVYEVMSDRCRAEKTGELRTDQEMVHEIAKMLLNNRSLVFKKGERTEIPEAMASWIRNGSSGDAYNDFNKWNMALDESWGARKFVALHIPGIC